jgi:hypothetical protein
MYFVFLDHFVILIISIFVKFSTSATVATFTAISRSSAIAIILVRFAKFKFSNELYCTYIVTFSSVRVIILVYKRD